jgi:cytochrome P450
MRGHRRAAQGRDDRQFPSADAVDFGRDNARTHVAFGRGAHACPGSLLARTEARISLEALLTRLDDIRLATTPEELIYVPSYVARGVLGLPLSFTPAGRAAASAEPLTAV